MTKRAHVDVDAVEVEAFGLSDDHDAFSSDWHAHEKHQILYAVEGTMTLTAEGRRWTLPSQRAAWISARTRHLAKSETGAKLRTLYLARSLVPKAPRGVRVFGVTPLAREMILHAMRWGPKRERVIDPPCDAFFRAVATLVGEWLAAEQPYWLPEARSPELGRAMAWINEHLDTATPAATARAAHVSVRTLSRRFEEEAKMTFRAYLQAARMMRAMELLALPRASVTTTAYAVGFRSLGAFTTAFTERCGETPSDYRARVRLPGM